MKTKNWNPDAVAALVSEAIMLESDLVVDEVRTAESKEEAIARLEAMIEDVEAALICVRGPATDQKVILDPRQLSTVLAALRYYQIGGQAEDKSRNAVINAIATNCDQLKALSKDEINDLCEKINLQES